MLTTKSVGDKILISLFDRSSRSSDVSCWRLFDGTLFKALFGNPRIWRGVLSPLNANRWTRLISPDDMKSPLNETPSKILASLRTVTFLSVQSRIDTVEVLFLSSSAISAKPWTSPLHLNVSGTSQPHSRLRLSVILGQRNSAACDWLALRLFFSNIEFFLSALLALLFTYLGFFERFLSLRLWSSSCFVLSLATKSMLWLILTLFTRCCCVDASVDGDPFTFNSFVISSEPFSGWLFCLLIIFW